MFKSKSSRAADKAAKRRQQEQQAVAKQDYFAPGCHRTYSCIHCRAHLANHDELISKLFQGNHGRAYLFNKVVNIGCKQAVERELLTGLHAVADIYCDSCETTLGWKYEQAFVPSQKYKEGKYIIELVHMLKENDWDLTSYNAKELLRDELGSAGNRSPRYRSYSDNFGVGAQSDSRAGPAEKRDTVHNNTTNYNINNHMLGETKLNLTQDIALDLRQALNNNNSMRSIQSDRSICDENNQADTKCASSNNGLELSELSLDVIRSDRADHRSTPSLSQSISASPKSSLMCSSRSPSDMSSTTNSSGNN